MTHSLEIVAEAETMYFDGDSNNRVAKELIFAVSSQNGLVTVFFVTGTFGLINLKGSNYAIDEHAEFILVLIDEKLDITLMAIQQRLDKDRDFQCRLRTTSQFLVR